MKESLSFVKYLAGAKLKDKSMKGILVGTRDWDGTAAQARKILKEVRYVVSGYVAPNKKEERYAAEFLQTAEERFGNF